MGEEFVEAVKRHAGWRPFDTLKVTADLIVTVERYWWTCVARIGLGNAIAMVSFTGVGCALRVSRPTSSMDGR
jgi:hypothetical protein